MSISTRANGRIRIQVIGGYLGGTPRGTRIEGLVVVPFTANADVVVPFGVAEAGAGVQLASDGAPVQLPPPLVDWNTPRSVATYNVLAMAGSTTMSLTGIFGRFELISVQVALAVEHEKTCPRLSPVANPLKPEKVT
jgi:hypothetical protein